MSDNNRMLALRLIAHNSVTALAELLDKKDAQLAEAREELAATRDEARAEVERLTAQLVDCQKALISAYGLDKP